MNCFDCAALGDHADAVAICADCGAAVCHDHAHVTARWLIRTMVINRVVAVDRPRVPSAAVSARPPAMPRRPPTTRRSAKQGHTIPGTARGGHGLPRAAAGSGAERPTITP